MDEQQSLTQKKIALAQSEHAPIIIELIKDMTTKNPLVADTEWKTIVNTITLEAEANLIRNMVDYLEKIRQGFLLEQK